ncbi:unnamed protein product, partial [Symbiodinium sp. CCMP2456]
RQRIISSARLSRHRCAFPSPPSKRSTASFASRRMPRRPRTVLLLRRWWLLVQTASSDA